MPLLSQQSQTLLEEGETEVAKDDVASIIWVLAVVLAAIEVVGGVAAIVIVAAVLAAIEVVGGVAAIVKVAAVLAATEVAGGVAAIVIVAAVVVVEVLAAAAAAAVEGAATTRGGREERTQGETMEEHDTKAEDEDNGKAWKVESKGRGGIDPPLFKAVSFRVILSDSSRFTRFSRLSREEVSV